MSIADDFAKLADATKPAFDTWVDQHPEKDTLIANASNPAITHAAFLRILKSNGAHVGKDALKTWREAHGYVAR